MIKVISDKGGMSTITVCTTAEELGIKERIFCAENLKNELMASEFTIFVKFDKCYRNTLHLLLIDMELCSTFSLQIL